jgi:hypothetical protein
MKARSTSAAAEQVGKASLSSAEAIPQLVYPPVRVVQALGPRNRAGRKSLKPIPHDKNEQLGRRSESGSFIFFGPFEGHGLKSCPFKACCLWLPKPMNNPGEGPHCPNIAFLAARLT